MMRKTKVHKTSVCKNHARQKRSIPLNPELRRLKVMNPGKMREYLDQQQKRKDIVETKANLEEMSLI